MNLFVLDASTLVSALSPSETEHNKAVDLLKRVPENQAFLVPEIFQIEVISAFARRGNTDALATVKSTLQTAKFCYFALDSGLISLALEVVEKTMLRAYDSIYVALALREKAELLTLDREVQKKSLIHYPEIFSEAPLPSHEHIAALETLLNDSRLSDKTRTDLPSLALF
jgi:predicted nucleic acid-binding protein